MPVQETVAERSAPGVVVPEIGPIVHAASAGLVAAYTGEPAATVDPPALTADTFTNIAVLALAGIVQDVVYT